MKKRKMSNENKKEGGEGEEREKKEKQKTQHINISDVHVNIESFKKIPEMAAKFLIVEQQKIIIKQKEKYEKFKEQIKEFSRKCPICKKWNESDSDDWGKCDGCDEIVCTNCNSECDSDPCNINISNSIYCVNCLKEHKLSQHTQFDVKIKNMNDQINEYTIQVQPIDTVDEITLKLWLDHDIPQHNLFIFFDKECKISLPAHQSLRQYSINSSTILYLKKIVNSWRGPIIVLTMTGKNLRFEVGSHDSILTIKQKILDRKGIPEDQQRLIFAGRQLKDEYLIHEYNININSVLIFVEIKRRLKKNN
jgi:ubiquitin-large subunit ribosomal protein L40e